MAGHFICIFSSLFWTSQLVIRNTIAGKTRVFCGMELYGFSLEYLLRWREWEGKREGGREGRRGKEDSAFLRAKIPSGLIQS